jgi:HlyD family secretion protein
MRGAAVAVALAALLGCEGGAGRIPVVEVRRQAFQRVVEAEGELRAATTSAITVPADVAWPLRITWLLPDGSLVQVGQVVARFDDLELQLRLASAEADRQVAGARWSKERSLGDVAGRERGRSSEAALEELAMIRAFARRDREIFSREQILDAELDEALQAARLQHAGLAQEADSRLVRYKLGLIALEARKADDSITRTRRGLDALQARAPHTGLFTLRRNWTGETLRIGDTVFRGMSLGDVSLVAQLEAQVFVLEAEAADLAPGKRAEVLLIGRPAAPVSARITQVEALARRRHPKSPTQYFAVVLALDRTDPAAMKLGQRVRARLFLYDGNALVVPRPALAERNGTWIAYRRESGGGFSPVPVRPGGATAGLVTVASGLREGDIVALRDPYRPTAPVPASPDPARPRMGATAPPPGGLR